MDEYGARVDDGAWREMVRSQRIRLVRALATTLMGGPLTGEDDVAVAVAVDRAVARGGVPLLAMVVEELFKFVRLHGGRFTISYGCHLCFFQLLPI